MKQHSLDLPWQTGNNVFLEWVVFCPILVKMCFFSWKFLWNAIEKFRQIWILYGRTDRGGKIMNFYRKKLNCVWKEIQLNFQQKSNNSTKMRLTIHCFKNLTLPFCTHETKECFFDLECTSWCLRKKIHSFEFGKVPFQKIDLLHVVSTFSLLMIEIKTNTSKWLVNSTSFFPVAILPRNEAPATGILLNYLYFF